MRSQKKYSLFIILLISLCFSSLVLMTSCKDSRDLTEPQIDARLVIDDGYYTKVGTTNSGEHIYLVVIKYHVEGFDFIIGNYDIQWKSENFGEQVFLNSMVVNPNKTLKIERAFTFQREISKGPIITITGYALCQKDDGATLELSYTIQKK